MALDRESIIIVNYYDAREKADANGKPSGTWHYTVRNDDRIHPVGYCAQNCPGHSTPDEAREHYRLYLVDSATYNGVLQGEQRECESCKDWTQGYASIPINMERHILCDKHRNHETLNQLIHPVGQIVSSY